MTEIFKFFEILRLFSNDCLFSKYYFSFSSTITTFSLKYYDFLEILFSEVCSPLYCCSSVSLMDESLSCRTVKTEVNAVNTVP